MPYTSHHTPEASPTILLHHAAEPKALYHVAGHHHHGSLHLLITHTHTEILPASFIKHISKPKTSWPNPATHLCPLTQHPNALPHSPPSTLLSPISAPPSSSHKREQSTLSKRTIFLPNPRTKSQSRGICSRVCVGSLSDACDFAGWIAMGTVSRRGEVE